MGWVLELVIVDPLPGKSYVKSFKVVLKVFTFRAGLTELYGFKFSINELLPIVNRLLFLPGSLRLQGKKAQIPRSRFFVFYLSVLVGVDRFELSASWSQTKRSDRAELHPEIVGSSIIEITQKIKQKT